MHFALMHKMSNSPKVFVVKQPILDLELQLGEGCVWDSTSSRLYFIDIDRGLFFVFEPATRLFGVTRFDKKITAFALGKDSPDVIAALEDSIICISSANLPVPEQPAGRACTLRNGDIPLAEYEVLATEKITLKDGEARLNEGAADPQGRFLVGSMTFNVGSSPSRLYSLRKDPESSEWLIPVVRNQITVTNGMAWTDNGTRMLFTDSHSRTISTFSYEASTGSMTDEKVFARLGDEYGYPDGLCVDDQGGVWSARWGAGKVVRLHPETGQVDVEIHLVNSWNVTCCIFGGPDLKDLYITTAACDQGDPAPLQRTESGKLYRVQGLGFKGVEREKFQWST